MNKRFVELEFMQPNSGFGGFQPPPPSSRAPTRHYDRQSYVLVLDEGDDVLKFLKMHLNRYFSRVVVHSSGTDAALALKQHAFDLIIAEGSPSKKVNSEFLKRVASKFRHIPIVLTKGPKAPPFTSGDFPNLMVIEVVDKPFEMDDLHVAIRRGLNLGKYLQELSSLLQPSLAIGKVVRTAHLTDQTDRRQALVAEIRKKLAEEISD